MQKENSVLQNQNYRSGSAPAFLLRTAAIETFLPQQCGSQQPSRQTSGVD